jgi:hypothetical protein
MDQNEVKNIFVSHIHEDDHRLASLKKLAETHGCDLRDASINSSNPNNATDEAYIKYQILAPRIEWASTLVVLVTPDTKDSKYVQWEIEYAEKLGKRIVGIWDKDEEGCDLPESLEDLADAVVPWDGEKLVDAILGDFNGIVEPNGNLRPDRAIPRHRC